MQGKANIYAAPGGGIGGGSEDADATGGVLDDSQHMLASSAQCHRFQGVAEKTARGWTGRAHRDFPEAQQAVTNRDCKLSACPDDVLMAWASVSDTVLPLIGVALGTTGTLLGQFLATRVEAQRELFKIEEGKRQERKAAIIDFLSVAQHAERIELKIITSEAVDDDHILDAIRDLWLAKKVIELVCSAEVAQTAHDYAWEIHKNIHAHSLEVTPASERERRIAFIETARHQMGFDGKPLMRPGRPTESASAVQQHSPETVPTSSD